MSYLQKTETTINMCYVHKKWIKIEYVLIELLRMCFSPTRMRTFCDAKIVSQRLFLLTSRNIVH